MKFCCSYSQYNPFSQIGNGKKSTRNIRVYRNSEGRSHALAEGAERRKMRIRSPTLFEKKLNAEQKHRASCYMKQASGILMQKERIV